MTIALEEYSWWTSKEWVKAEAKVVRVSRKGTMGSDWVEAYHAMSNDCLGASLLEAWLTQSLVLGLAVEGLDFAINF